MLATFLSGLGTGAGLIIAIGAQNAFVLRQGLLRQHVLPVVLVCIGGDILCICAGVAGMGALIRTNEWLLEFFRWGGALFLTVYGISAARRAASGNGSIEISEVGAGSLMKAITSCLAFTFLNPHVYLDTVVLLGSIAAQYGEDLKWAFAADVVRFYAVYKEGGVYMDSDILMKRRFDRFVPEHGFATFHEHIGDQLQLQAAFFMGEQGNRYCKDVFDYYNSRPFVKPDGSLDMVVSPVVMLEAARARGYVPEDKEQHLADDVVIYPGCYVTPCKRNVEVHPDAIALHTIYGSWRKRKVGRRIELFLKHVWAVARYVFFKR